MTSWKHTYLYLFFCFLGWEIKKHTYLYCFFGFLVFGASRQNFNVMNLKLQNWQSSNSWYWNFVWRLQKPKIPPPPKNHINMCISWFHNPKNPKSQYKHVCFQLVIVKSLHFYLENQTFRRIHSSLLKTNQIWAGSGSGQNW